MSKADPYKDLKQIDELLEWWTKNETNICQKPDMTKKYRALTLLIKDYRRRACDLMTIRHNIDHIIERIDKLLQINHKLTDDLGSTREAFSKRLDRCDRDLNSIACRAGFPTQVLITRWLHEAEFRITDIEVEHEDDVGKHSFDIEIEARDGCTWDIEVWQGTAHLIHKIQRAKSRFLGGGMRHTVERRLDMDGIIGDDDADFRTLTKKMGQMRKCHTGLVVACIRREQRPDLTLIPKEWGPDLPENRCVIALRIGDGEWSDERRGTAYLVCSPKFKHTEAVKTMIESLKFEYVPAPLRGNTKGGNSGEV